MCDNGTNAAFAYLHAQSRYSRVCLRIPPSLQDPEAGGAGERKSRCKKKKKTTRGLEPRENEGANGSETYAKSNVRARSLVLLVDHLELLHDLGHCRPVVGFVHPHALHELDDLRAPLLAQSGHGRPGCARQHSAHGEHDGRLTADASGLRGRRSRARSCPPTGTSCCGRATAASPRTPSRARTRRPCGCSAGRGARARAPAS
jgi:hypothetical protein